ncbi:MAG: DUF4960 domain-containing protein [Candidatus Symbiothrix sp.]|jgi:hypothetical protein|nr:DUF4960 domain-containing protein [Candidatus Symbiothrix sp.]
MTRRVLLSIAISVVFSVFAANAANKVAYLSIYESVNDIDDDDEKAAAQWVTTTYGGDFLPVSQVTPAKLSEYTAVWLHVDDEYYAGVPDEFIEDDVLDAITAYYKAGGNLLLSTHGCLYLKELGRVDLNPDIVGTGTGATNPDIWYVSGTHGTWSDANGTYETFDSSSDKIYEGLTYEMLTRTNGKDYKIFPLIGAGWKEDHNVFWSMEIPGNVIPNSDPAHQTVFQTTYAMQALGTWSHVEDYFGAAIARWLPQGAYKGTAITIGVAAYEWNQKSTTNPYQSNVQRLTKNALDELKGSTTGLVEIAVGNVVSNKYYNLQGVEITAPVKGSIYIEKATYESGKSVSKVRIENAR